VLPSETVGTRVCRSSALALLLAVAPPLRAADVLAVPGFHAAGRDAKAWTTLLGSFGLRPQAESDAHVLVVPENEAARSAVVAAAAAGRTLIVEGDSPAARELGFRATSRRLTVKEVRDVHNPDLPIVWEHAVTLPVFEVPAGARVVAEDRGQRAPLMAVQKRGPGGVLWLATSPGVQGYERFPYVLQALAEAGASPAFESRRLWAFYDSAFQREVPPETLARQWRQMGLAAIHVGAWDYFEPGVEGDLFLGQLIEACHDEGILVYAWLELPHVSTEFWNSHPAWRERTATLRDAAVDWRLLMNLANPECRQAVAQGIRQMLARFDWDGVNLAELYFDGTEGVRRPEDLTPMNEDVRREVRTAYGFDPLQLFSGGSRDPRQLRQFLDYRADLAARLQEWWIDDLEQARAGTPDLDLVLTHVDDRFDTTMRDAVGADASRLLRVLDSHELTFIIEDPATVWHLGPGRYSVISAKYRPLTPRQDHIGVDINVVERSQAWPTLQQSGAELAELIHVAAESFARVMFYYTGSISPVDAPLLPAAAATVARSEPAGDGLLIDSRHGVGVRWAGPVTLDGEPWPVRDAERVWVPPGRHVIRPSAVATPVQATDFNGTLTGAQVRPDGVEIRYTSDSRAFVRLDRRPLRLLVDGQEEPLRASATGVVRLPRGSHTARVVVGP
jgi:glycosyl hydrolase family 10